MFTKRSLPQSERMTNQQKISYNAGCKTGSNNFTSGMELGSDVAVAGNRLWGKDS